jgi:cell shape-determining protein MreD
MDYPQAKILLAEITGLHKDALHVHAALLLYLLAALLFRRQGLGSPRPWLTVMAFALANEGFDLWHQEVHGEPGRWRESVKDLLNTMLWPSLLLLAARQGWLARGRKRSR